MRRRLSVTLVGFIVVFVLGVWFAGWVRATAPTTYDDWNLLADVFTKVKENYAEPVNDEKLLQAAVRGMLQSLDPHSQFFDAESYSDFQTTTHGSFGGIGIQIGMRNKWPTVISPIEGTPAYLLGIQTGDRIVLINGKSTENETMDDVIKQLRGPKGTTVGVGIAREGEEKILSYTITRDIIQVKSIPYAFVMPSGYGYARVTTFSETTSQELQEAMDKFTAQNVKGVVIDLRFNPGGLLQQAVETAQMFVPRGGEIVETRPRSPKQATPYFSRNPKPYTLPLVVLVNGGSASASEIFAGAIQDHDLGLVVGTLSYGKGSVQSLFPLSGGKALKLTTAKWYTPSGRCIHKDEGERDLVDAEDIDTIGDDGAAGDDVPATKKADRPKYKTLVRNRVVYGGGGITPDVEVKPEPLTAFENKVEGRGLFFTFAVSYAAQHKGVTASTPVTDDMVNQVLDLARKEKVEFTADEATRDRSYIERAIRREIARRVSGDEAAFRVQMEGDKQLTQAVDLLSTYKTTARLLDYAVAHPSASEAATR